MSLTDREAFKFGFLMRCADENLDDTQIQDRLDFALTKQAGLGRDAIGGLANLAGKLPGYGLLAALGGGSGLGYLTSKLTEDTTDVEDAKQEELMAAYSNEADRVRREGALRRRKGKNPFRRVAPSEQVSRQPF